jgi:hypothetical protein
MKARRRWLGSVVEWLIAAAFITAVIAAGALAVRQARAVRDATSVSAEEGGGLELPADLPARTISLPMLLLADGKEIRLGDRVSEVLARVGRSAQLGSEAVERTGGRQRFTRFYSYVGARFALVFERTDADAEPRVAGIYLQ